MTDMLDRLKTALSDRYTVEREIGRGGMAVVYLAEDLKHHRKVAVKVLRPELSAVIGAERFLNEIKVTANLQHPHILALFDSGEADSFVYYVMPYVDGESLREKLDREKQFSIEQSIEITRAVASALDYAHRRNVIHRDIKPENILLHDGQPVVADFGIALAVKAAGGTRLTETGLSLGTPQYMSPEQATADREIDGRSDIYSLACVLYEMLSGEPPHTGPTVQAVIAKVVTDKPRPISELRDTVPNHVAPAVHKALAKLPADRFATAAEYVEALTNPGLALPSGAGVRATPIQSDGTWRRLSILLSALAALLAVTTLWGWLRSPAETEGLVTRVSIRMPEGEEATSTFDGEIALSPDGTRMVYVGPTEGGSPLWLRPVDSLHARPLRGTELARGPFFSPDGDAIGFVSTGVGPLRVIPAAGGPPQTLVEAASGYSGAWGGDGMVYFGSPNHGISRIPSVGGEIEVLTTPDTSGSELRHSGVYPLPNGKGALFTIWRGQLEDADIAVVEYGSGEVHHLLRGFHPLYAMSGHLLYVRSDAMLMAVPFDQDAMELTGPTTQLSEKVMLERNGMAEVALSNTGTLLYRTGEGGNQVQPVWVDRDGVEREIDPEWIDVMFHNALSPDGNRLTLSIDDQSGRVDIWIKTLDRGPLRRLTFEGRNSQASAWTPDGRFVTFASGPELQEFDIWQKRADGTEPATLVLDLEHTVQAGDRVHGITWSADGQWLVFQSHNDIYGMRVETDSLPTRLVATDFNERSPSLSPDGRWLTYSSDESGQYEVYLRPFPNANEAMWQVSVAGGKEPQWAHNGRELFYINGNRELVVVEVETETMRVGPEHVLFSVADYRIHSSHSYSVARDDQQFVMMKVIEGRNQETVLVLNFFEELKQRVGNGND